MSIDPQILALMAQLIPTQAPWLDPSCPAPVAERRARMADLQREHLEPLGYRAYPELDERDEYLTGDGDPIHVRIFTPPTPAPRPGYLFFFGGGFWQRSFDGPDIVDACRRAAAEAGVTVVQLDYPLAPEHPYPAAVEAGFQTLTWMAENAAALGIDPDRLAVGGQSSGGNLAAATALYARDHGGPALKLQILEVPALDLTGGHLAAIPGQTTDSPGPQLAEFMELLSLYGVTELTSDPYVSPLLAPDHAGLPPALILAAEFDPLRGDAEAYAETLRNAGVPVT
ncbi:MAG: alpha/beta hydrolase, partial [Propionibacteriaceae bacterium]|nr:alpha/beta hydrolase [Propionibacteriaceae bacterium]